MQCPVDAVGIDRRMEVLYVSPRKVFSLLFAMLPSKEGPLLSAGFRAIFFRQPLGVGDLQDAVSQGLGEHQLRVIGDPLQHIIKQQFITIDWRQPVVRLARRTDHHFM